MALKRIKRSKFKVNTSKKGKIKRTFEGIIFDSDLELRYYRDHLLPLKESGNIKSIILQPKYLIQEKFSKFGKNMLPINYVADFKVEYTSGEILVVDVKGLPTPEAKIKRKLFDFKYPDLRLEWISFSAQDGGWISYDELVKLRAKRKREKKNKNGK